jgi:hypothetical protein
MSEYGGLIPLEEVDEIARALSAGESRACSTTRNSREQSSGSSRRAETSRGCFCTRSAEWFRPSLVEECSHV